MTWASVNWGGVYLSLVAATAFAAYLMRCYRTVSPVWGPAQRVLAVLMALGAGGIAGGIWGEVARLDSVACAIPCAAVFLVCALSRPSLPRKASDK